MNRKGIAKRNKLIIEDYGAGMLMNDIAQKYKTKKGTIAVMLKKAGIWIRGRDINQKGNPMQRQTIETLTLSDGTEVPKYIKALYDPKNIITTECLSRTVTYRSVI